MVQSVWKEVEGYVREGVSGYIRVGKKACECVSQGVKGYMFVCQRCVREYVTMYKSACQRIS